MPGARIACNGVGVRTARAHRLRQRPAGTNTAPGTQGTGGGETGREGAYQVGWPPLALSVALAAPGSKEPTHTR